MVIIQVLIGLAIVSYFANEAFIFQFSCALPFPPTKCTCKITDAKQPLCSDTEYVNIEIKLVLGLCWHCETEELLL